MALLRVLHGSQPGQIHPLNTASVVLGRHPACDIVLESVAVSRQHARIVNDNGTYYIEDLHSRNGTLLNGQPVLARQPLTEGDEIGICDLSFVFHLGPSASTDSSAGRRDTLATNALLIDDDTPPTDNSTTMSKLDLPSGSTGLRLEVNTAAKLKALLEISQNLGKALGLAEVLSKLLDSLFTIFPQADRGFVVLRDPQTNRLVPQAVKYRRHEDACTVRVSRTIVNSVMACREAVLSADAAADARFDVSDSIVDFQIRSMMCAPLVDRDGRSLGVIQLDTLDPRNRFRQDDLDVLASVACQATFAVENAQLHEAAVRDQTVRRELAMAHEVQRGFLPSAAPRIPEYDFFDFYEPANQLGGDYYDYVELPRGRLGVVVADVSGKGISASLLMAKLSAETRFCLASEPEPAQAISRLNRIFCQSGWEDRFVTMVLCVLDPKKHEVIIVNAGHLPPLLRCGPRDIQTVGDSATGLPLGVDQDTDYTQHAMSLEPSQSLIVYTDGITEAMNAADELYGRQRLIAALQTDVDRVELLGRRLLDDVKQFVGARAQSDDMCLACFGRVKVG